MVDVGDIQAGTLDLTVNDQNPCTEHITIDKVKPGDTLKLAPYYLRNIGNLPGVLSIEISPIKNYENGMNEPEKIVDKTWDAGELGANLKITGFGGTISWDGGGWFLAEGDYDCLNDLSGGTFTRFAVAKPDYPPVQEIILDPFELTGNVVDFRLELLLPIETGNIVQGDSVEFDITLTLEQV